MFTRVTALLGLLGSVLLCAAPVLAQQQSSAQPAAGRPARICGQDVPPLPPSQYPPAGSGPVVYLYAPCFEEQGGASVIEPETYLYYIQLKPSRPSMGEWTPWND